MRQIITRKILRTHSKHFMDDKEQEFIDLIEFIQTQFDIELQPYQQAYLKHLINNKNSIYTGGANMGKTALLEKYLEFKKQYEKDNSDFGITTSTRLRDKN